MVFGLAFFIAGTATWMTVFNLEVPSLLNTLTVALMPIAYGAAFITATVVRYIIIPEEIALKRPFGTSLKITNWSCTTTRRFSSQLICSWCKRRTSMAVRNFPHSLWNRLRLVFLRVRTPSAGVLHLPFLDPRINLAPVYLLALLFACSLFYFGLWGMSLLIQWNALLGGLALAFWVSRIVLFRRQVNDNPYAFQFST